MLAVRIPPEIVVLLTLNRQILTRIPLISCTCNGTPSLAPKVIRPPRIIAAILCLPFTASATEWQDLKAHYKTCTLVAGLGKGDGLDNPNEWNNAEGQPATSAELSEPHSAMADIHGRIFVADKNANAIRRIDPDGTIHTVAGMNLSELPGALTNAGYNGDGPARQRLLDGPQHAYVMPDGTFYILDSGNRRIRRVNTAGMMTTVFTDSTGLNRGLWVRRDAGLIYYCTNGQLKRWTPALGSAAGTILARSFAEAGNIDVDHTGNIYVTDRGTSAVYRVPFNHDGTAVTPAMIVAGTADDKDSGDGASGNPATTVGLLEVRGIAFHPLGGYFLATHAGGDVWYVDQDGEAHFFIQGSSANDHDDSFRVPANSGNKIAEPRSVTVSLAGDVIIASNDAGYIRVVRNILPKPAPPVWDRLAFVPGTGMQLRWQSAPGNWYLLENSANLTGGGWHSLSLLPSAGSLTSFTDTAASGSPRRFYRLNVLRDWPN